MPLNYDSKNVIRTHFDGVLTSKVGTSPTLVGSEVYETTMNGQGVAVRAGNSLYVNQTFTQPFTVQLSAKLDNAIQNGMARTPILDVYNDTNNYYEVYFNTNGNLAIDKKIDGVLTTKALNLSYLTFPTGKQIDIVLTYDGSNINLYYQTYKGGGVILQADDGIREVYNQAKPICEKYNAPFTLYTITARTNVNSGYCTSDELLELQNIGWEIGSHTHNHLHLTDLTEEEVRYEFEHSKSLLEGWGINVTGCAFPYGYNDALTKSVGMEYYTYIRPYSGYDDQSVDAFDVSELVAKSHVKTTTTQTLLDRMDEVIALGKFHCPLFHDFDPNDTEGNWNIMPEEFDKIVKHARDKGYPLITYRDAVDKFNSGIIEQTGIYSISLDELNGISPTKVYMGSNHNDEVGDLVVDEFTVDNVTRTESEVKNPVYVTYEGKRKKISIKKQVQSLKTYGLNELSQNKVRVYLDGEIRCHKLVEPDAPNASFQRVALGNKIWAIEKE